MQPCNPLEVSTVIRQESQMVTQGAGTDEEVKVANKCASRTQPPALSSENLAGLLVNANYLNPSQKIS
jgi:hypothetical protein